MSRSQNYINVNFVQIISAVKNGIIVEKVKNEKLRWNWNDLILWDEISQTQDMFILCCI